MMSLDDAQENLRLIRDSASAVVPRDKGPQRARSLRMQQPGFDQTLWKEMCRLGWAGLRTAEARGGSGLDVMALCAVAQQMGASLSPEPFIAVTAATRLLSGPRLQAVMSGDQIVVPAWMEQPHDLNPAGQTRFVSGHVNGTKRLVANAMAADAFVVATLDGLALVDRGAPGVTITSVSLHDGCFAGDVVFANAPGEMLAGTLERVFEESALASAAYLLGAMEAAFDMTLSYLSLRQQFGKPIGSFQALQHRAVDLKIQMELTRAVINDAACALDRDTCDLAAQHALVSRAKVRAGDAAMLVARESVQFHGAMGMTDDCDIGLYARKLLTAHNDWGSVVAHRQRFAAIEQSRED